MIYTLTFNPSLDYLVKVNDFEEGKLNRTCKEQVFAGGKGINVSIMLNNLHHESVALGFIADFTGRQISSLLQQRGIACDFIEVKEGMSRINVKMRSSLETEINGMGPNITSSEVDDLFSKLSNLENNDILVVSGSVPKTLPDDMYEQIMYLVQDKNIKVVVDATQDLLVNVLHLHPFLIKPNNIELSEIFGVEIINNEDVIYYAKKLQDKGAQNVLVSMGAKGAVLVDETGCVHTSPSPSGELVNSVGAGDSMVAGFISGYLESDGDYSHAFLKGIAAGSASAFSVDFATNEQIENILQGMQE